MWRPKRVRLSRYVSTTTSTPTRIPLYGTPRSWLATATTIPSTTASPAIRKPMITIGSFARPAFSRLRTRVSCTAA